MAHLFLLGANDHVLPTVGGGLLNRRTVRRCSSRAPAVPTGMERLGNELQNIYAALAQPPTGLTVSYPVTDAGANCAPFVVERMRKLFPVKR